MKANEDSAGARARKPFRKATADTARQSVAGTKTVMKSDPKSTHAQAARATNKAWLHDHINDLLCQASPARRLRVGRLQTVGNRRNLKLIKPGGLRG
jgi:hypothetical protein